MKQWHPYNAANINGIKFDNVLQQLGHCHCLSCPLTKQKQNKKKPLDSSGMQTDWRSEFFSQSGSRQQRCGSSVLDFEVFM